MAYLCLISACARLTFLAMTGVVSGRSDSNPFSGPEITATDGRCSRTRATHVFFLFHKDQGAGSAVLDRRDTVEGSFVPHNLEQKVHGGKRDHELAGRGVLERPRFHLIALVLSSLPWTRGPATIHDQSYLQSQDASNPWNVKYRATLLLWTQRSVSSLSGFPGVCSRRIL